MLHEDVLCAIGRHSAVALNVSRAVDDVGRAGAETEPAVGRVVLLPPEQIVDEFGHLRRVEIDDLAQQLLGLAQQRRKMVLVEGAPHRLRADAAQRVVSPPGVDVEQVDRFVVVAVNGISAQSDFCWMQYSLVRIGSNSYMLGKDIPALLMASSVYFRS